jgi:hypothetical protein
MILFGHEVDDIIIPNVQNRNFIFGKAVDHIPLVPHNLPNLILPKIDLYETGPLFSAQILRALDQGQRRTRQADSSPSAPPAASRACSVISSSSSLPAVE